MGVNEDKLSGSQLDTPAQSQTAPRPCADTPTPPYSRTLLFLSLAFFLTFLGAGAFQQYVKPLHGQLHMTSHQAAWVLITVYLSFLVWRIFCAFTLYSLGDYWSIFCGLLTYAGFAAMALLLPSFPSLLISAIIWGWGAATLWIASSSMILDITAKTKHGTASGVFYAATHAGQGLGVLMLSRLLGSPQVASSAISTHPSDHVPLTTALTVATLFSVAAAMASLLIPRQKITREKPRLHRIFGVLHSGKSKMIAFTLFVSSLGFGILLNGLGPEIKVRYGLGALGIITQGFYASRLLSSFFGGAISDRVGRVLVVLSALLLAAAGLGVAALFPSKWSMFVAATTLGLEAGIVPVAVMAMIGDATGSERRHLVFGALYVWRDLGVVVAMLGGEYIEAWSGSRQVAFAFFAVLYLMCSVVAARLGKHSEEAL